MADGSNRHPWQPDRPNVSARLQSLRNLLNSERSSGFDGQRALDALDQEMSERSAEAGLNGLERRRRDLDIHLQDQDTPAVSDGPPPSSSPSLLARSRRRAIRPSQRIQRNSHSVQTTRSDPTEQTGSNRRTTPPPIYTDTLISEQHSNPTRDQSYRAKRRKLEDGTFDDDSKVISYGDKGRVTPGTLRLQIVSCDGGEHEDAPIGMVEHVLKDDPHVYSTKSHKCNLVLKHVGGMPFSLTKIVFKAPREDYTAPVQEGLVFIAMDDDKLIERTSQYEVKYSPKTYRYHQQRRYHDIYRPSQDYLHATRPPVSSIDRSRYLTDPYGHPPWSRHANTDPNQDLILVPGFDVSFSDPSDTEETPRPPLVSPFRHRDSDAEHTFRAYADRYRTTYSEQFVEMSSSESDDPDVPVDQDDEDDRTIYEAISQHRQLLDRMRPSTSASNTDLVALPPEDSRYGEEWHYVQDFVHHTRRSTPSRIEVRQDSATGRSRCEPMRSHPYNPTKGHTDTDSRAGPSTSDLLVPHARFFIRRTKTAIAVKFDPPVAGRYILIKLWSACPNANIDIQSIVAHGYGGPRFFPACELR